MLLALFSLAYFMLSVGENFVVICNIGEIQPVKRVQ